eukprot:TRINITY_DN22619_c0_g1_i1.p1 TRINITY_DN22619_c0_g1~~TRINITY_DN22619_c0_g1_i1.p1  ORF type:complete len:264 (+),score=18.42 TRINITY_DN22619_c0_g1_i1:443-1234(+)
MEDVLSTSDSLLFDAVYEKYLPGHLARDSVLRQWLSTTLIITVSGYAMYFLTSTLLFWSTFDRSLLKHPKYLKNQVSTEIGVSLRNMPLSSAMFAVVYVLHFQGWSRVHEGFRTSNPVMEVLVSVVGFFLVSDCCTYWFHRSLHHPLIYGPIHKVHHQFKVTTPYASCAMHFADMFWQGMAYHVYGFLFPINRWVDLLCFSFFQFFGTLAHGQPPLGDDFWIGARHHNLHHSHTHVNFGQTFTFWDRHGGTYLSPFCSSAKTA